MDQDTKVTRAAWPNSDDIHTPPAPQQRDLVPAPSAAGLPVPIAWPRPARRWWLRIVVPLAIIGGGAGGGYYWWQHLRAQLPAGIAFGNGRLEADEIDIDTKYAGRIAEILADEGDLVKAGQVVARMDTQDLAASLKKSQAQVLEARRAVEEANANVAQQNSLSLLAQQELDRAVALVQKGFETKEVLDQRQQQVDGAIAALHAAQARVIESEHALDASTHDVELYNVQIADNTLVAPRIGRIEYRIANIGEVLPAGGKVFAMLDTSDVYMDVYLPTEAAGQVRIRRRCPHRARRLSGDRHPGPGVVHRLPGAVHAENRRDAERARQADVPHPRPHRSGALAHARRGSAQRLAGRRLYPDQIRHRLAARPAGAGDAMIALARPAARLDNVTQCYGSTAALDAVTVALPAGRMVGLIGPDGVGKSTLLGIVAGARQVQSGHAEVLGGDIADSAHRTAVCSRIAYMPQGLGRNLYPDLSVAENIQFFGRLFGQSRAERQWRIAELLDSTGLKPFVDRPAKKLSGGMRQKLGLCCSLIHDPDLLILDEPTTGVDPLSRRQFWELIDRIRARRVGMSVVVATAYMEEAERFDTLIAMNDGRVLATGSPAELKTQAGVATVEEAFIALLPEEIRAGHHKFDIPPRRFDGGEPVIVARGLTCRFGDFTAVDRVNFTIERGEIFGFVGSNGCGKTTTMKMLTGLLPPSEGEALLFGRPLDARDIAARLRVGYMSQSFSLYTELTVRQNLELHARLFHLPAAKAKARIDELTRQFGLGDYLDHRASDLPLGIRQRLSLAVAVVHEPEMLILDEPTSGVDPLARDRFWELLIDLSRNRGVTIFVSTHFMNEAERCDRISLMDSGRVLATDTPANLVKARGVATLEDAFIAYLEDATGGRQPAVIDMPSATARKAPPPPPTRSFSPQRLFAYAIRETIELLRDPIRLTFALFGTAFLMLVFGFGISTDVNNLTFAVLDHDQSHESRAYLEELRGSRYFVEQPPLADYADLERRLQSGAIDAAVELPPNFGRDIERGRPAWVGAWIDGAMPFRAQTIRGYLQAMHQLYLSDPAVKTAIAAPSPSADIEIRFKYNQDFESVYAMVPSTMSLLLALFPAILMALAIVREKELGSITNLYVTPVTRLEFLIGKQLPYIGVAMANFALMFLMALFVFQIPLKGSFLALLLGVLLYVTTTTAYGMMISAFTRTQIAALFGTSILTVLPATQFSGMMVPVSALSGAARIMGSAFPMTYFVPISVGTFTKGLQLADLGSNLLALGVFIPILTLISLLLLRKQER